MVWERPPVVCQSITRLTDPCYEIRILVNDVVVERRNFNAYEAAARYVIDRMNFHASG